MPVSRTKPINPKQKCYLDTFGEPVLVAHNIVEQPHVDIYIFANEENDEYIFITLGMESAGFREMVVLTNKQVRWPAFLMQAICGYQIQSKTTVSEMETFDNIHPINECKDFNNAIFLDISTIGLNAKQLAKKLKLKDPPLYIYPITTQELKFALDNSTHELVQRLKDIPEPYGDIERKTTV